MKLFTNCISCKEGIPIKSYAPTRPDLEKDKGEEFKVNCTKCGKIQVKHINDVYAKQNNIIVIGGLVISVVATLLLLKLMGAIAGFTFLIPVMIWKQQTNAAHAFNSYMRPRR